MAALMALPRRPQWPCVLTKSEEAGVTSNPACPKRAYHLAKILSRTERYSEVTFKLDLVFSSEGAQATPSDKMTWIEISYTWISRIGLEFHIGQKFHVGKSFQY